MAKIGRKLMTVVAMPVITAPDTSDTAERISPSSSAPLRAGTLSLLAKKSLSSTLLTMLSIKTTPTSTITPIAIAMPDSATTFASTPTSFIKTNVQSTVSGSMAAITTDARKFSTKMSTTIMQMSTSSVRELSSVPIVSLIR